VAQRQVGRIAPRDFPGTDVEADVVSEEEQTDNTRNGRKPGTARLSGDESFPKVDDATNPENLADNQHHEEGEEEQETERTHFAPTGGQPEGAKGNQRESDHARDHAPVSSEETHHRRCRLRAGNAIIDMEPAETAMDLLTQFRNKSTGVLFSRGFSS